MGLPDAKETKIEVLEYASTTLSSGDDYSSVADEGPKYSVFKQPGLWWKHNYLSWRFYVTIYAGLALICSFVVLLALIAAAATHGVDKQGRITLFEGSCSSAKLKGFFGHGFISGMGTYMLSASCYVLYCLTPPSRKELDRAHSRGRWLDIGAMSWRNLRATSRLRVTYFILLALSSPILQLLYVIPFQMGLLC
jgi:hypothetical protein